jgi:hypothetical protein
MGRPFKLTDHQKSEAIQRREQGETLADIARSYNVSPARKGQQTLPMRSNCALRSTSKAFVSRYHSLIRFAGDSPLEQAGFEL